MIFASWAFVIGGALAVPDTVPLPQEWPAAFPQPPAGAAVAGVTRVEAAERPAERPGPYFIIAVDLPGTEQEGFAHYREALLGSEWEILEALTNDGSRPGLVTIGFRGHGYAGDIRFQEVLGSVLATIHLYREAGPPEGAGARAISRRSGASAAEALRARPAFGPLLVRTQDAPFP
jgi:hypothetical protein